MQAGAGGLSPFGGWSFVIADLSLLFAVFLLQTSQISSVSASAPADLERDGGDVAHRSLTVGVPLDSYRGRLGALGSGTQSSAHLGAAKPMV